MIDQKIKIPHQLQSFLTKNTGSKIYLPEIIACIIENKPMKKMETLPVEIFEGKDNVYSGKAAVFIEETKRGYELLVYLKKNRPEEIILNLGGDYSFHLPGLLSFRNKISVINNRVFNHTGKKHYIQVILKIRNVSVEISPGVHEKSKIDWLLELA